MRPPSNLWQRLNSLLLPVAHAHPGHYGEGFAKGQMLQESSLDLLAGAVPLPAGNGVTGVYRSGTFAFSPALAGPHVQRLQGHTVVVKGVATKGDSAVHFLIDVDFDDIRARTRDGLVQGCVFDEANVNGDGLINLAVKPRVWFNLVDFAGLPPGAAEAPTRIPKEATAHIAFVLGLVQLNAYRFSFSPEATP